MLSLFSSTFGYNHQHGCSKLFVPRLQDIAISDTTIYTFLVQSCIHHQIYHHFESRKGITVLNIYLAFFSKQLSHKDFNMLYLDRKKVSNVQFIVVAVSSLSSLSTCVYPPTHDDKVFAKFGTDGHKL